MGENRLPGPQDSGKGAVCLLDVVFMLVWHWRVLSLRITNRYGQSTTEKPSPANDCERGTPAEVSWINPLSDAQLASAAHFAGALQGFPLHPMPAPHAGLEAVLAEPISCPKPRSSGPICPRVGVRRVQVEIQPPHRG